MTELLVAILGSGVLLVMGGLIGHVLNDHRRDQQIRRHADIHREIGEAWRALQTARTRDNALQAARTRDNALRRAMEALPEEEEEVRQDLDELDAELVAIDDYNSVRLQPEIFRDSINSVTADMDWVLNQLGPPPSSTGSEPPSDPRSPLPVRGSS